MVETVNLIVTLVSVAAVIIGLTVGRSCERRAALICAGTFLLTILAQLLGPAVFGTRYPVAAFMIIDLTCAVGLGCLAVRFADKLWPGVAASFQFFVFTFSASRLVNFPLGDHLLVWASNLAGVGVVGSLILGSLMERWGPKRESDWDRLAAQLEPA